MNKENDEVAVRLDKWMWASRFCKTRSLARTLIQSGKVSYNGQPCKPGKIVELGAVIKFPAGYDQKEVVVKELSDKGLEHKSLKPGMKKPNIVKLKGKRVRQHES